MRSAFAWLVVAATAGCSQLAPTAPVSAPAADPVAHPGQRPPDVRSAAYALYWAGRRVGEARERLTADRFVRRERLTIRRGDVVVELGTEIDIELGPGLAARRVIVTRTGGGQRVTGRAVRHDDRWRAVDDIDDPDDPGRWLVGDAVPIELVPWMLAARDDGDRPSTAQRELRVLLSGHGFATADLYVRPLQGASNRVVATMALPGGLLTSEIQLDDTGAPIAVTSEGGLESRRVDADELYRAFDPPELVDTASIAVAGTSPRAVPVRLVIDGVTAPPPPPMPGQLVRASGDTWTITLSAGLPGALENAAPAETASRWRTVAPGAAAEIGGLAQRVIDNADARTAMEEIRALARYTDRMLTNDLGAAVVDARSALATGRGDCKAHAALFAELALTRGFEVALVTGYRLMDEPSRLARHRWALVRLGGRWLAVDPTYGEVPAAPRLLGLAIHGVADRLALADEVAFAGFAEAAARTE